jgi:acyl-CoA thioester hydrolase
VIGEEGPGAAVTYRGVVYPWQCDHMGHMNVMWYVGKFDEATWQLFAALGLTAAFLREHNRGMAAVEQHLTYERELLAGDTVEIVSALLHVRTRALTFRHRMSTSAGEPVATSTLTAVHLDLSTRRATALPERVRSLAQALGAPE